MSRESYCHLTVWTEHFLGTENKCRQFLELLGSMDGGRWTPDKWGHYEPIRSPYSSSAVPAIVRAWTEERPPGSGRSRNAILFRKSAPKELVDVSTSRDEVPLLNRVSIDFAAKPFSEPDGPERLVEIMRSLVRWSNAVYATLGDSRQLHKRSVGGTPLLRLQRLDWLTFFGAPYIEMFGRSRLMNAPCHHVGVEADGVMMLATPRPDSFELTTSDQVLLALENHLNHNAFAGHGYPQIPCRVPSFDLSDTLLQAASTSRRIH